jgi:hypothetical protein
MPDRTNSSWISAESARAPFRRNEALKKSINNAPRRAFCFSAFGHPGRLSERRALGPPSLGDVVVHTTPIAVPASATIGEPDIPPRARGKGLASR